MTGPARALDRVRHSFAAKLLLALTGSVGLLLLATIVAIRLQTRAQVQVAVNDALRQSRRVFAQQEADLRTELRDDAGRLAGSNRLPAALDEALQSGATDFLAQTTTYELGLAKLGDALAAYTDPTGRPVLTLVAGRTLADPAQGVPAPLADWLARSDTAGGVFGYAQVGGRLYAVYVTRLVIFGNVAGMLTLGKPVSDAVAANVGVAVGAEVCFVAAGRCVASSPGVGHGGLHREMVRMAGANEPSRASWGGRRYVLAADRIATGRGMQDAWRVTAIPLDRVLAPFERIQRAAVAVGFVSLVLSLLLGRLLSRGFARPVRELVAATARVAEGDYDVRVHAATRDELGTLAGAFNDMTHGLMLKERYRGVLDKVVSRDIADELLKGEITLGGETRRVATLFADVRGFTAFTEGMEPQRVISLLNEIMERASDAVEAEGGVVDKYVGDAVMAVFGAPMSRGGDAERAVRAALRIRDAVAALNAERAERGEAPLGMGIGINVGPAVAGNMGSTGRLNYTVLGESVNVASRLCDVARAGEILVTATVLREAATVDAALQGPRAFKGLSEPLDVYAVRGLREGTAAAPGATVAAAAGAGLALLLALAAPAPARAQHLPTLQEAGIRWSSPGGTFQVTPSGRIDLEGYAPGDVSRSLIETTHPFVAGRASLFLDLFAGKRVYGLVEGRLDRGEAPQDRPVQARIEQAYLRLTPIPAANLSIQAGKFVSPFGNYPQRHHTSGDPFIRPPLPYDYRTMVAPGFAPGRPTGFVGWKDAPQIFRPIGAPPVWGAPYQVGAMVMGAWKTLGFRVALMNSAPSSEPEEWNAVRQNYRYSFVAHAAWQVIPELKLGVSYDRGPYMTDSIGGAGFEPGKTANDYPQQLWGFEATLARGPLEARGELLLDTWDVPRLEDPYPRDISFYGEAKVKLTPGLFAAFRYSGIRFNRIPVESGNLAEWDYPLDRMEFGAGYRLSRNTEIRAEYMLHTDPVPPVGSDDLFAVRWTWQF